MKASSYLFTFWLLTIPALAQKQAPQLLFSHSIPASSPTAISQDRSGNVYLLDDKYNLLRLDPLGRPIDTFSPPTRGRISTIEAWNPMKMLLFYQDRQDVMLLDRFMRPISSINLTDVNYQGIAKAASLAADDGFWLFDETNVTLSKLDAHLRKPVIETPLNLILDKEHFDVRMLREYQNMVYLLDYNSGIFVFDNLGNYLKKLPLTGVSYIGFRNNELYFVQKDELHFLDLYTLEEHVQPLPHKLYLSAIVNDSRVFLFRQGAADVYIPE
ncbi:hypothetical protein I2I11_03110 [Pontibacter sp. 172403-2]|uniref:hypothetical protein n=1 Tax=Pontibacter rufus TaxID=2791028 RepID=UPI0018AFFC43|nr:hypothetical protein [Pontibacter sp. 172403-2]MBF9252271.1 hypothetical protein [Pontibacter sp. 172403-2]